MPRLNPDALTFGTFTASNPPVAQVVASAQALENAGFDHVWSGDQLQYQHPHALWRPELCDGAAGTPKLAAKFALQPLMSVLGQHTSRVCIGQGVLDAIRRGPAILAQEFLTTQHFTQGRAIFALAAGEWKNIGPYGYSHAKRDSRLCEAVEIVRRFFDTQSRSTSAATSGRSKAPSSSCPPTTACRRPCGWRAAARRYSITLEGNMATLPLERALELCRQVPRAMVEAAVYAGTAEEVAAQIIPEVEAGARHLALCNYVGFLSRADAPAATAELLKVAQLVRARFPELAARPALIG